MEIACPAWYPGVESLVEAISQLADQGATTVEICTHYPRFGIQYPTYFDNRNPFEITKLLSELSSYGVRVNSVHAPFGQKCDLSSPIDEIHERGVDSLLESIELANVTDARFVIVHASDTFSNGIERRMDRARGVLREMAAVAEESGVIIAIENLPPGYLGQSPGEITSLIDGIRSGCVGVCFDSGHANLSGKFSEYSLELLPLAVCMHIHDNDGVQDQHKFPGEGSIDWAWFGQARHDFASNASITLECAPPTGLIWGQAFQRFRNTLEN